MAHPVLGITRLPSCQPLAGSIGNDRNLRFVELDALQVSTESPQYYVEQAGVRSHFQSHPLAIDAFPLQAILECVDSCRRAGRHGQLRTIGRSEVEIRTHERSKFRSWHRHTEHGTFRHFVDELAAKQYQSERILKAEHAGDAGSGVLAKAVADHCHRGNAVVLPEPGQCVLDQKDQR